MLKGEREQRVWKHPSTTRIDREMKPCSFRYFSPVTVEEAVAILAEHGDEAKVLAGGQSLVPMMNMRLARPAVLVDINNVTALDDIAERDGRVAVGALVRQRSLERNELIVQRLPVLPSLAEWMSHPQIRNRGTVVGSVVHADPAAELPAAALVLEAEVVGRSVRGQRTIPAQEFYLGYYATELAQDELATEVLFPPMSEDMGWGVYEVCRRRGDFALAGMVVVTRLDGAERIADVRMAAYGFGGSAFRLRDVEMELVGQTVSDDLIEHAARRSMESVTADDDIHAGAAYRRSLAGEVARRSLAAALDSAGSQRGARTR